MADSRQRHEFATDCLQAMERLYWSTRNLSELQSLSDMRPDHNDTLQEKMRRVLDELREIKAVMEGRYRDFVPLAVNDKPLLELKQLLLMVVPSCVTNNVRQHFTSLIGEALSRRCKKILGATVLTCPWYVATQKERGEQAKHNILLVVVMNEDQQFFSPCNFQVRQAGAVVDKGWLLVIEMQHYAHFLVTGRTRYIESVLCGDAALVYSTPEWQQLRQLLLDNAVTGLRSYMEACCAQAMGSVAKKRMNGGMKLRDGASLADICEAFRLLHNAHNRLHNLPEFCTDLSAACSTLPDVARHAVDKLKALYSDGDVSKQDIFDCLHSWHVQLKQQLKTFTFTQQQDVTVAVGGWMMTTRLQGRTLNPVRAVEDDQSELRQLLSSVGGPMSRLAPHQILLVARAGSFMYGLATPDSDVDYVVVYADSTEAVLSACSRPTEAVESRGPTKQVEYGAYEVRLFCEMLLKGSVVILELVFVKDHKYVSDHWKALHEKKEMFVTEVAIQQYLGLIKNNFATVRSNKHMGTSRERKLFYQIFHKLDSVRHMMSGTAPPVTVSGPLRDFIMDVRTKPLEGQLSRESILARASREYEELGQQLAERKSRLPEHPDVTFLCHWLIKVRGEIFL